MTFTDEIPDYENPFVDCFMKLLDRYKEDFIKYAKDAPPEEVEDIVRVFDTIMGGLQAMAPKTIELDMFAKKAMYSAYLRGLPEKPHGFEKD